MSNIVEDLAKLAKQLDALNVPNKAARVHVAARLLAGLPYRGYMVRSHTGHVLAVCELAHVAAVIIGETLPGATVAVFRASEWRTVYTKTEWQPPEIISKEIGESRKNLVKRLTKPKR